MNFETALRAELDRRPVFSIRARRLRKVLDAPPSARRTKILARLERHAAASLQADHPKMLAAATSKAGAIDWSAIDWNKVFETILTILLTLLPLFV